MAVEIHETAIVHPGARLGEDVVIGPHAIVEDKVEIGDGSKLDAFAQVKSYTRMGAENRIHSYAIVGGEPQHLSFHGEESWVVMGEKNIVREYATVHRGTEQGLGKTEIGSGCMLMGYVHVAHDCVLGDQVIMANASSLAGHVVIGDQVMISGMSGVHQFVRIGEHSFLGAMSGFRQDVPPFCLASGVRAKLLNLNLIGLRRRGFARESIQALKKAYQMIFRSDMIREQALAEVESKWPEVPEVQRLVTFLRESERGVIPVSEGGIEDL